VESIRLQSDSQRSKFEITIDYKEKIYEKSFSIMVLVPLCALALRAVDNAKVLRYPNRTEYDQ
jgi:hypothetical protein